MKWIALGFGFLSSLLTATAALAAVDPSLVTVISNYTDSATPTMQMQIQGTGFLVADGARMYVFTASHVSQGQNLKITQGSNTLNVIGRKYDGIHDFEVLEVTPTGLSSSIQLNGNFLNWNSTTAVGDFRARQVDKFNWLLLNDWVQDWNVDQDNQTQSTQTGLLHLEFEANLLGGTTLVQPGASGAPLITKVPLAPEWTSPDLATDILEAVPLQQSGQYFVRGLAIRRDRFFARSSFLPTRILLQVLNAYKNPSTQATEPEDQATWKIAGGLQYRVIPNVLQEAEVVSASCGSGTIVTAGNGTIMEGGDGADLPDEDYPNEVLKNISAFPTDPSSGPALFWMFMQRDLVTSALIQAPIWFDMDHYMPLERFTFGLSISTPPGANVLYIRATDSGATSPKILTSTNGGAILTLNPHTMHVQAPLADGGNLSFDVNDQGQICSGTTCPNPFLPVAELQSSTGGTYIVDLRSLLTINPTTTAYLALRNSSNIGLSGDAWTSLWMTAVNTDLSTIKLYYRPQRDAKSALQPMTVEQGTPIEIDWNL